MNAAGNGQNVAQLHDARPDVCCGRQTGAAPGHYVTREVALLDFEIVLAADFADIPDIGAHGFRKYFRLSANDFESVGRQDLDHVLLREREVR